VEALLQIHSLLFSHSIKLRGLALSAATVSLHYQSHAEKRHATATLSERLKIFAIFCYAIETNSRTIFSQASQPASVGKGAGMSEQQAHHCMTPKK